VWLVDACIPSDPILHDEYLIWLEAWVGARTNPALLHASAEISRSWSGIVAAVLREGVEAGVFRLAAPLDEVCVRFVGLANDLGFRCVVGYPELGPDAARSILTRFVAEQVGLPWQELTAATGDSRRRRHERLS
jgi:hypothetical protein